MKVRLKDIAKLANVSVATVSIVLNHPETTRFSKAKKQEILDIAKELNYTPNIAARTLVTNKSNAIGLIIPDIENPFFSSLAKTIEAECRAFGSVVIMMNTNEDYKTDPKIIRQLSSKGVDGLIIAPSDYAFKNAHDILEELDRLSIPYVLVDRTFDEHDSNQVIFNNKKGQYLATKHAIDKGHKKIGYISVQTSMTGQYRYLGYKKGLREAKIKFDKSLVCNGSYSYESGYQHAEKLINEGVSVIVCANDLIAFGVMRKARELKINVPNDLSIIGYDNLYLNDLMDLGLTTVDQDTQVLGQETVRIIKNAIDGEKEIQKVVLEPSLKIRNSVVKGQS